MTQFQTQAKLPSTRTTAPAPSGTRLLQRKCACGGSAGLTGECEECQKEKLLGTNGARLQKKLAIGEPGDQYEQEADRIAEQVTSGHVWRTEDSPRGHAPQIQRHAVGPVATNDVPPIVHEVLSSEGQPLDSATRGFFEPRFGYNFGQVRVHSDGKAAESAEAVGALAYTLGSHIVFGAREHTLSTENSRRLLAHELTHVVQQSGAYSLVIQRQLDPRDPNMWSMFTSTVRQHHPDIYMATLSAAAGESQALQQAMESAGVPSTDTESTDFDLWMEDLVRLNALGLMASYRESITNRREITVKMAPQATMASEIRSAGNQLQDLTSIQEKLEEYRDNIHILASKTIRSSGSSVTEEWFRTVINNTEEYRNDEIAARVSVFAEEIKHINEAQFWPKASVFLMELENERGKQVDNVMFQIQQIYKAYPFFTGLDFEAVVEGDFDTDTALMKEVRAAYDEFIDHIDYATVQIGSEDIHPFDLPEAVRVTRENLPLDFHQELDKLVKHRELVNLGMALGLTALEAALILVPVVGPGLAFGLGVATTAADVESMTDKWMLSQAADNPEGELLGVKGPESMEWFMLGVQALMTGADLGELAVGMKTGGRAAGETSEAGLEAMGQETTEVIAGGSSAQARGDVPEITQKRPSEEIDDIVEVTGVEPIMEQVPENTSTEFAEPSRARAGGAGGEPVEIITEEAKTLQEAGKLAEAEAGTVIGAPWKTALGKINLTVGGAIAMCASPCTSLRSKYAGLFARNEQLNTELVQLEARAEIIAQDSLNAKLDNNPLGMEKAQKLAEMLKADVAALEKRILEAYPEVAQARELVKGLRRDNREVVVNLGGEAAEHEVSVWPHAINVNPDPRGRADVPNLVREPAARLGELFDDESVDQIVARRLQPGVLDGLAQEIYRVLRRGGTIDIHTYGKRPGFVDELTRAGFDVRYIQNESDTYFTATKPGLTVWEPYVGRSLESSRALARERPGSTVIATEGRYPPTRQAIEEAAEHGVRFVGENSPSTVAPGGIDEIYVRFPIPHEKGVESARGMEFFPTYEAVKQANPHLSETELIDEVLARMEEGVESIRNLGPTALERLAPNGTMEVVYWERSIKNELDDLTKLHYQDPSTGMTYRMEYTGSVESINRFEEVPHSGFGISQKETYVSRVVLRKVEVEQP
jgi:Domain of unknown function (DUF4157)